MSDTPINRDRESEEDKGGGLANGVVEDEEDERDVVVEAILPRFFAPHDTFASSCAFPAWTPLGTFGGRSVVGTSVSEIELWLNSAPPHIEVSACGPTGKSIKAVNKSVSLPLPWGHFHRLKVDAFEH